MATGGAIGRAAQGAAVELVPSAGDLGKELAGAKEDYVAAMAAQRASLRQALYEQGVTMGVRGLEAAEAAGGLAYQWVLRTRTDLVFVGAPLSLMGLSPDHAFVPSGGMIGDWNFVCLNDHMFLCPLQSPVVKQSS